MSEAKEEGAKLDLNAKFKETDPIKIILAIFFPPVAVYLEEQGFTTPLIINCLLTFFMWFPGVLHAFYIIFKLGK